VLQHKLIHDRTEDMFGDTQAIRSYFFKLGLSSEIADVYLALYAYGAMSISELSRRSGLERTHIYRLMDELQASNLIEIEERYKRKIIRAAPIANLQILLSKKEEELRDLYQTYEDLRLKFVQGSLHTETTKVQAYKGPEGLKQMYWNETRAKTENLSILYENMQVRSKLAFFERWVRECNSKDLKFRSIIGDNFIKTQREWYGTYSNERLEHWEPRYVPDGVFSITHSLVIYDDVTSYYNWKDGEVFGIEVYNSQIANAQRQFFEMLWNQGIFVDDLSTVEPGQQINIKKDSENTDQK
jgi:sugar-specific transcriptional regulator TrmB